MASIVIKDLNESKNMDREAMRAVIGGSSARHIGRMLSNKSTLFQPSPLNLISRRSGNGIS